MTNTPNSGNTLPSQTPNSSAPIATVEGPVEGLYDSLGKPITGSLQALFAYVTPAWRYLFGTFVQRSNTVSASFSQTAGASYSQSDQQALIAQVEALSKVVGK